MGSKVGMDLASVNIGTIVASGISWHGSCMGYSWHDSCLC
jgi:hypothetical protein